MGKVVEHIHNVLKCFVSLDLGFMRRNRADIRVLPGFWQSLQMLSPFYTAVDPPLNLRICTLISTEQLVTNTWFSSVCLSYGFIMVCVLVEGRGCWDLAGNSCFWACTTLLLLCAADFLTMYILS